MRTTQVNLAFSDSDWCLIMDALDMVQQKALWDHDPALAARADKLIDTIESRIAD